MTVGSGLRFDVRRMASRWMAWIGLVLGSVLAGALTACSSLPPAPSAGAPSGYSYIIGPGDALSIQVWRNPELSATVPVRPDGKLSTPLVDELYVQGKDATQVAREVEKALSKYIRDPVVTVIVNGFVGPYSEQVRVVGEAAKPQALPYRNGMTVLDVMIAVGGLTDFADGNGARIVRASDEGRQYRLRLKDLIKRGDISANVDVRPGDVIIIPQSLF